MIAVYILLGVLAFLLLLLLIPFNFNVSFDQNLLVKVRYAFIPYTVYPQPEKPEKPQKQKKTVKKEKEKKTETKLSEIEQMLKEEGIAAAMEYLSDMAKLVTAAFRRTVAAITIDTLKLKIRVVSDDAASTAVDFGRVCAAVYPVEGLLESVMHVRRQSIEIQPDFLGEKGEIKVCIRFHVIPLRILSIAIQFFIGYIGNTMRENS